MTWSLGAVMALSALGGYNPATTRSEDRIMQMVKIQIPEREDRVKSLVELARRGRIVCLPDNVFVVPEPALELLRSLEVSYVELGRGGLDYSEKALRDSLAAQG
jgi:hypothetical protein